MFNVSNLHSQGGCPPGFDGPYNIRISLCEGSCYVIIEWCCFTGPRPTIMPVIAINKIMWEIDPHLPESGCSCLNWDQFPPYLYPVPLLPLDKVIYGLYSSGDGCYAQSPFSLLDTCPQTLQQIVRSSGGCYWWHTEEMIGYKVCSLTESYCQQSVSVCVEYFNGEWHLKTTRHGYPTPQYDCNLPCHPLCRIFYLDE